MAINPFDLSSSVLANPFGSSGGFNAFSSEEEPERGFLSTLVHETGLDIKGAAKVGAALTLSPFAAIGLDVPITIEDIDARDVRGAGAVLAMVASGGAARLLPAATTWVGRAASTFGAEAAGGAIYGALAPDEGESRLNSVVENAILFGGIGAGASAAKSAYKATIGSTIANLRAANAREEFGKLASRFVDEQTAREFAGVTLANSESGTRAAIRRNSDGRVIYSSYESRNGKVRVLESEKFKTFDEALIKARAEGFVDEIGPYRKRLLERADVLDESTRASIMEHPEGIAGVLGKIQLEDYKVWKDASVAMREAESEMAALGAETLAPTNALGVIKLDASEKRAIARAAGLRSDDESLKKIVDADVVRAAVKKGVVDLNTLQAGVNEREFLRDLFVNSALPSGSIINVSNSADTFFSTLLTPFTVAKIHKEISPLVEDTAARGARMRESSSKSLDVLSKMRVAIPREKAIQGVDIIDRSIAGLDEITDPAEKIATARELALVEAAATGDEQLMNFVETAQNLLEEYLKRSQDDGVVKHGLAGYFPIQNSGQWEVKVVRGEKISFEGFKTTREEALKTIEEMRAADPTITRGSITPKTFAFEGDSTLAMHPKQYGKLVKALRDAGEETLSWEEAKGLAKKIARPVSGTPLKSAPNLKKRTLGIRDFSDDPFDALETYIGSMERMLAFRDYERAAKPIIDAIPANKPQLKRWAEQYVNDVLGRPHQSEIVFQNAMNWLADVSGGKLPVPERALKTYSAGLRRWVTASRLSGVWSPVVNTTQMAVNVYPVLGAKHTGKALEVLNPKKFHEVAKFFENAHFDLGLVTPFSEAGTSAHHEKIRTLLAAAGHEFAQKNFGRATKNGIETVERASLFLFNGSEKVMRLATAWGAYNKGLSEGMSKELALEYAKGIERRTMFDYSVANTPQALRGPIRSVLFQFKQFFVNELEFIASLTPKEAVRFGASLQALGGAAVLFNMPGTDIVDAASGAVMDQKLSERLKLAPEGRFAKGLVYGLPGAVANVDLSDSVGVGSLADITRSLFGPGVRDAKNASAFFVNAGRDVVSSGRISPETMNIALHQLLPTFVRNARVGAAIAGSGEVRNQYTGKLVYKPEDRLWAGAKAFAGAPQIQMTQERTMEEVTTRMRERFVKARTSYAKEAAMALKEGDGVEAQRVMLEAREAGFELEPKLVNYWIKEMGKTGAERRARRTPTQLREEYASFFDATT